MVRSKMLGASLYVPSNHQDLLAIANEETFPQLRSVIFCTEDAVSEKELSYALFHLSLTLEHMKERATLQRFVRIRNLDVMERVLAMHGAAKLTGFVLPKITRCNLTKYLKLVRDTGHMLMPTLETAEVFDDLEMCRFRNLLGRPGVRNRILALRIGGIDLLALLGMRRPRNMTIYRTPLGPIISRLVTTFLPYGFALTAPAFEYLDNPALLEQEVTEDLAQGLVGKTAVHPDQVALIEQHYQVLSTDIEVANRIMCGEGPAVFKMDQAMCEIATHTPWAKNVIHRATVFGVRNTAFDSPVASQALDQK